MINNCCVKTAAGTFFGLVVVSSLAISTLPFVTSLIPSGGVATSDDPLEKLSIDSGRRDGFHGNHSGSYYESYWHDSYDVYIRQLLHRESAINGSNSDHFIMTNTSTSPTGGSNNAPVMTPWVLFFTIVVCLTFYRVAATSAFTTLGIVVNDSVDKEMRGINTDHCLFMSSCSDID